MAEGPRVQPILTLDPYGQFQLEAERTRILFHMMKSIQFKLSIQFGVYKFSVSSANSLIAYYCPQHI